MRTRLKTISAKLYRHSYVHDNVTLFVEMARVPIKDTDHHAYLRSMIRVLIGALFVSEGSMFLPAEN